jgi:hypothetical protein
MGLADLPVPFLVIMKKLNLWNSPIYLGHYFVVNGS